MPPKRKSAVLLGGLNRFVEKTSLVSLKNAAAEVGIGCDWRLIGGFMCAGLRVRVQVCGSGCAGEQV